MRDDVLEFSDPFASFRSLTQKELKIAELVSAYSSDDMDKVALIHELEKERLKWKAYHRNLCKYRAGVSKE